MREIDAQCQKARFFGRAKFSGNRSSEPTVGETEFVQAAALRDDHEVVQDICDPVSGKLTRRAFLDTVNPCENSAALLHARMLGSNEPWSIEFFLVGDLFGDVADAIYEITRSRRFSNPCLAERYRQVRSALIK